jgi:hypothetical protein
VSFDDESNDLHGNEGLLGWRYRAISEVGLSAARRALLRPGHGSLKIILDMT